MKRRAAIIMLALMGSAPAGAHDWFSGTRDPVTGHSCCGVSDCYELEPDDVRLDDSGGFWFRHPDTGPGVWHHIEAARVQPSRSGKFAGCVWFAALRRPITCGFAPSMF